MSKERLEEMNKKVIGLTCGEDFSDLVQMDVDTYAWFYEQAERVQELEGELKAYKTIARNNKSLGESIVSGLTKKTNNIASR